MSRRARISEGIAGVAAWAGLATIVIVLHLRVPGAIVAAAAAIANAATRGADRDVDRARTSSLRWPLVGAALGAPLVLLTFATKASLICVAPVQLVLLVDALASSRELARRDARDFVMRGREGLFGVARAGGLVLTGLGVLAIPALLGYALPVVVGAAVGTPIYLLRARALADEVSDERSP